MFFLSISFSLSFADFPFFSHVSLIPLPRVASPPSLPLRLNASSLPLLWDTHPSPPGPGIWCNTTSPHILLWDAPHARHCFPFLVCLFFFFADCSPFLTSAQGPLSLQMRVGIPSSQIHACSTACDTTLPAPLCLIQGWSPFCGSPCKVHTYL
jgi:hypothetical protein